MNTPSRTLWLLPQLADPERPWPTTARIDNPILKQLIELAEPHGVLPIVWRKLGNAVPAAVQADMTVRLGQAMFLESHANRLANLLGQAEISFAIVKGPTFARRLYDWSADRPFTDIDLLVGSPHVHAACEIIGAAGFERNHSGNWDNSDRDMEYKFTLRGNKSIMIELHGNLVHYPSLRRRVSFGYDELVSAGKGDPDSPAALLISAIVHVACGHKFHRLQMIVDVLQGARRLPEEDVAHFVTAAERLGLALEAAVSLSLAGRLFGDQRAATLASRFTTRTLGYLGRALVTPSAVIKAADPSNHVSWARRKSFRMLQFLTRR